MFVAKTLPQMTECLRIIGRKESTGDKLAKLTAHFVKGCE
jgi:hypothetical protein